MSGQKDREKILIVEDSPTQAEQLRYVLEQHGYQVILSRNGREAMNTLAKQKPDLVISDILMPEADGYEVCQFVRQHNDLHDLPVILLTALSDPVDVMRALECGADNFIIKPFEEDQLLKQVQSFLINQDLRRPEGQQAAQEVVYRGRKYIINSDRLQILNFFFSTYEAAVERNAQLLKAQAELEAQSEELRVRNEELKNLTEDLRISQKETQGQAQILAGINLIFHGALTAETEEKLGETCLAVAEGLTGSRFGFIGELNREGKLDDLAISYSGWENCKIPGTQELVLPTAFHVHGIYGVCLREGRPEIVNDPANHPDSIGIPEGHPVITSFLGVPLKRGGETIGMIALGNKAGGYTSADREAMEALAPVITEAFMRKRAEAALKKYRLELEQRVKDRTAELRLTVEQLLSEIEERQLAESALLKSEERLRFLASQLLNAQETERKRLALELHDALGQSLLVLKMQLGAVEKNLPATPSKAKDELSYSLDYIDEVIENVRRMSRDLRPSALEDLGLESALKHLIEEFVRSKGIEIRLDMENIQGLISPEAQIAVFRIFQESLTNIAKHADATLIKITIEQQEEVIAFLVEDNGKGFELREVLKDFTKRGLGLTAMDERIRLLGGELNISSKPGSGTEIFFILPMHP